MTWIFYRLGRSAFAAFYLCIFLLSVAPTETFGRFVAHVHYAFWCSVIEAAVLSPIDAMAYLSNQQRAPRVLQLLKQLVSCLWSEVACSSVARWVQLFVVHASLDRTGPDTYSVLIHGISFLCIVQIVHDITGFLRMFQATIQSEADDVWEDAEPLSDDHDNYDIVIYETLIYVFLAGQALVYGFLARLFTLLALYLERMAAGTFVTALSNAHSTLTGWRYCAFVACAALILTAIPMCVYEVWDQAEDEADEELLHRRRELREGRPPPGVERWRPTTTTTIPWMILRRLILRSVWVLGECFRWLMPWRYAGLGQWFCPEAAALLSEGLRRHQYAAALTGAPSSMLAALWAHGPLRRRHFDLWRRAGLTTDFVLSEETAVHLPRRGAPSWGIVGYFLLGRVAAILVRGLEATLCVFVVVGGIAMAMTR